MDRAITDTDGLVRAAFERDPKHLAEVIAKVARTLVESGHSKDEATAAVEELLAELARETRRVT
jgi:polyhydroxyalkanoate synthesis regulator phasin